MVKMCGGTPIYVTTLPENNYTPTPDDLRQTLKGTVLTQDMHLFLLMSHIMIANPTISSVILCNPSNPTGAVASKEGISSAL